LGGRSTIGGIAAVVLALTATPAGAATFKEYPIGGAYPGHAPRYIKAGPDGNLWFADGGSEGGIGRISPHGELFTEFGPPGADEIAFPPNGLVFWTSDQGIYERTQLGEEYSSTTATLNYAATTSPSGEIWFSSKGGSWCHPPVFSEDPTPQKCNDTGTFGRLTSIAFDRAGNAWGAFFEANLVQRLSGTYTRVELPTKSGPARIALGPEGDLWVSMFEADAIDRITPEGQRIRFPVSPGSGPNDIVLGPDGAFWFTEYKSSKIGRMTTAGVLTGEFPIPTPNAGPTGIAVGPDGAIWFTELLQAKIGRLSIDPSTTTPVSGAGGPSGAAGTRDTTPPSFSRAPSLHPSRFRDSGHGSGRIPKGSSLTFTLSEASSVKVQVAAARPGRRSNGSCVGVSKSDRGKPHCVRYVTAGSVSYTAVSGPNRFAFSGRVGGHALKPGAYRLTAVATDAAGNGSAPARVSFTIAP
jgi:streptogramin lyase